MPTPPTPSDGRRPSLRELLARCDFARMEPHKLDRLVAEASQAEGLRPHRSEAPADSHDA